VLVEIGVKVSNEIVQRLNSVETQINVQREIIPYVYSDAVTFERMRLSELNNN
jgi:hypothetical protein